MRDASPSCQYGGVLDTGIRLILRFFELSYHLSQVPLNPFTAHTAAHRTGPDMATKSNTATEIAESFATADRKDHFPLLVTSTVLNLCSGFRENEILNLPLLSITADDQAVNTAKFLVLDSSLGFLRIPAGFLRIPAGFLRIPARFLQVRWILQDSSRAPCNIIRGI